MEPVSVSLSTKRLTRWAKPAHYTKFVIDRQLPVTRMSLYSGEKEEEEKGLSDLCQEGAGLPVVFAPSVNKYKSRQLHERGPLKQVGRELVISS